MSKVIWKLVECKRPTFPGPPYLFPFSSVCAVEVIEFLGEPQLLRISSSGHRLASERPVDTEPTLPDTKQAAKQRNQEKDSFSTWKVIHVESHDDNTGTSGEGPCDFVSFGHVTHSPASLMANKTSEIWLFPLLSPSDLSPQRKIVKLVYCVIAVTSVTVYYFETLHIITHILF